MPEIKPDIWSEWLLQRRFGGDAEYMNKVLTDSLYPIRDKVLTFANLGEDEVLLDIGCGDGLISFGALEKSTTSRVIFSDISSDLLTHAHALADKVGVSQR